MKKIIGYIVLLVTFTAIIPSADAALFIEPNSAWHGFSLDSNHNLDPEFQFSAPQNGAILTVAIRSEELKFQSLDFFSGQWLTVIPSTLMRNHPYSITDLPGLEAETGGSTAWTSNDVLANLSTFQHCGS